MLIFCPSNAGYQVGENARIISATRVKMTRAVLMQINLRRSDKFHRLLNYQRWGSNRPGIRKCDCWA